jgi:ABC-type oligopeptide transport system substrate-binding subunit
LRFRLSADPSTLDWNLAHTNYETHVIMNLMEGLLEEGPDLKPRPALAASWTVSPDGLTYTFTLRKGVQWSDGRPLKAQDFADSWIRLLSPQTQAEYAHFLYCVKNAEEFHSGRLKDLSKLGVKASNDSTFVVTLKEPLPYFLHLPSFWVTFPIRMDLLKKNGQSWATPGKLVTLGPFMLADWQKGRNIRLVRNPKYYGGGSSVARIEIMIEPSDREARKLFDLGTLDLLLDATTDDLLKAKSGEGATGVRAMQFPYLSTTYLGFNVAQGPLKYVSVRKALATALHRELIPNVLNGGQTVARGIVPPGVAGHDYSESHLTGTAAEGRAALERIGFGSREHFPKLHLYMERFDRADELAKFAVHSFRESLGVLVETHVLEHAEFQKILASGKMDLFIGQWGADFPDPATFFELFESGSRLNYTGWKNTEYDRAVAAGAMMMDADRRARAYSDAEQLLLERDVAIYPLYYAKNTALTGRRVKAFSISPLNYLFIKDLVLGD